jgi:hypothetical protein
LEAVDSWRDFTGSFVVAVFSALLANVNAALAVLVSVVFFSRSFRPSFKASLAITPPGCGRFFAMRSTHSGGGGIALAMRFGALVIAHLKS